MAGALSLLEPCCYCSSDEFGRKSKHLGLYKLQLKSSFTRASQENLIGRRLAILCSGASLVSILAINIGLTALPTKAEGEVKDQVDKSDSGVLKSDSGVLEGIKSIFDPNEKTKSGKLLPKAYLKAAREVVKRLRESLEEDTKDVSKFRRSADAAKESIREFLNGWRGQQAVVAEESYAALEKAIRSLAKFYSKAGPFATPSEEVKLSILDDLKTADAYL